MTRTSDIGFSVRSATASTGKNSTEQDWLEVLEVDLGPERQPRDQAALLLTVAAEIEHALMAQYLYAAYSIRDDFSDTSRAGEARGIATRLIQIAREEMGHLITVQNLLHVIGAPPHFGREHSPFESELYPFRFKLEPVAQATLAKYVTAESPMHQPQDMDDAAWERVKEIAREARTANDGQMVRHVGAIFEALTSLFKDPVNGLKNSDFIPASAAFQAKYEDWGYDPGRRGDTSRRVLVDTFIDEDATKLRQSAVTALEEISEQGEGAGEGADSHFERFLEIYDDFARLEQSGHSIVRRLATNPTVRRTADQIGFDANNVLESLRAAQADNGLITDSRSLNWAYLFNFRYRLLLDFLAHYLRLDQHNYVQSGSNIGDRTPKGFLLIWSFDQMRHIKRIAEKLVTLPLRNPADGTMAGPPFQLPFTLALPETETARWRVHLDVVKASQVLIDKMISDGNPLDTSDPFLADLAKWDTKVITVLDALTAGNDIPDTAHPTDFQKVVQTLEEAVRGFSIDVHENFWANKTRHEFTEMHMFNGPILGRDPENNCRLESSHSQLVGVLSSSMPRFRPPVPKERLDYLRNWIDRQAPDNQPPGEIGIKHERLPSREEPTTSTGEAAMFAATQLDYRRDIFPLFRDIDLKMAKVMDNIDLSDEGDVSKNAADLTARLEAGVLPYDANWPPEKVAAFKQWVNENTSS